MLKIKIYEDENYTIEKIGNELIISYFEDNHYLDEIKINKNSFLIDKN
jgi:hypothetical protein